MCKFYSNADPIDYESRTRSMRIHGVLTSIRLENFFWDILGKMAKEENLTTNGLIIEFHNEILKNNGYVINFTSFLRVTCMRWMELKATDPERKFTSAEKSKSVIQENLH